MRRVKQQIQLQYTTTFLHSNDLSFTQIVPSHQACLPRKELQPEEELSDTVHYDKSNISKRTYFPLIFHPGSSLSSLSAISLLGSPTTTSLLTVRREQTLGAPGALAIGPMASSNGVAAGAAQSYVSFRWFKSPLKMTRSERERCKKRSGASVIKSQYV